MAMSNKRIVLEVLKRASIDVDPTVIGEYFAANDKQHDPMIPDGPSAQREPLVFSRSTFLVAGVTGTHRKR